MVVQSQSNARKGYTMAIDLTTAVRLLDYDAIEKLYNRMAYNKDADVVLSNADVEGYTCLAYYVTKYNTTWYLLAREKDTP